MKATAAALLQPTYPAATRNIAGPMKAENKSCDISRRRKLELITDRVHRATATKAVAFDTGSDHIYSFSA